MAISTQLSKTSSQCFVALCLVIGLIACSQEKKPTTEYDLYLVRHFQKEKPATSGSTDVNLTANGSANAVKLANIMVVHDIKKVFSTNYKRTRQTAQPSANVLNITIEEYDPRQLEAFAKQLLSLGQNALVVGHSNTTGELFGLLGCESVQLNESDYGDIFKVSLSVHEQLKPTITSCSQYKLQEDNILFVQSGNLSNYWQYVSDKPAFKATRGSTPDVDGWVELGLIISIDGVVIEKEVLQSSPEQAWVQHALVAADNMIFEKAQNANITQSIYTTWIFHFNAKP